MFSMLGKKLGMTQVFNEAGELVPVTILEVGPCPIVQVKNEQNDGYNAVQLGFGVVKASKLTKAERLHLEKKQVGPVRHLNECRIDKDANFVSGQTLTVSMFEKGDSLCVTGTSKGKGFQGCVKRHGKSRGPMSHGSDCHRRPGSTGMRTWPHRVVKNKRMPGHMGDERITVSGLKVERIILEQNLLMVKGAVPGAVGGIVRVLCRDANMKERFARSNA